MLGRVLQLYNSLAWQNLYLIFSGIYHLFSPWPMTSTHNPSITVILVHLYENALECEHACEGFVRVTGYNALRGLYSR
jgi:hypothetical protein